MWARADDRSKPLIRFQGVAPGSPLGRLFASSVSGLAGSCGDDCGSAASDRWRAVVKGTSLQWWQTDRPSSAPRLQPQKADIIVDFFGNDPDDGFAGRYWRVVNGRGEPILSPFCYLDECYRKPYVASLLLAERATPTGSWTVIDEAHFSNVISYQAVLDRAARIATHLVATALHDASRKRVRPRIFRHRLPARSAAKVTLGLIRARLRKAAFTLRNAALDECWAVGISQDTTCLTRSGVLKADSWISASPDAYLADPFPWHGRSDTFICERFEYRTRLGELCAVTLDGGRAVREMPLDLKTGDAHLSYPFTFQEHERTYLLPEMAAFGKLVLFELVSEADVRIIAVIGAGANVADPTLFVHDDLYWIAYTDLGIGIDDNLCLLYASHLQGPWHPHRRNPVKIDIRSSRPGGTPFLSGGKLYRPAQDCSAGYGSCLSINEVQVCTPDRYEEQTIATLRADRSCPFPHGVHTLARDGQKILFDGKRVFFDAKRLAMWLAARLRLPRDRRR